MVVIGLTLHSFYGLVSSLICYEFNNFSMSHSSCVRWNCRYEIHITYWYPINLLYIELKHQADFDICWLVGQRCCWAYAWIHSMVWLVLLFVISLIFFYVQFFTCKTESSVSWLFMSCCVGIFSHSLPLYGDWLVIKWVEQIVIASPNR
jgi:hypothetical protein